jgi:hypothetical protein
MLLISNKMKQIFKSYGQTKNQQKGFEKVDLTAFNNAKEITC